LFGPRCSKRPRKPCTAVFMIWPPRHGAMHELQAHAPCGFGATHRCEKPLRAPHCRLFRQRRRRSVPPMLRREGWGGESALNPPASGPGAPHTHDTTAGMPAGPARQCEARPATFPPPSLAGCRAARHRKSQALAVSTSSRQVAPTPKPNGSKAADGATSTRHRSRCAMSSPSPTSSAWSANICEPEAPS